MRTLVAIGLLSGIVACDHITGPSGSLVLTLNADSLNARASNVAGAYQCAMTFKVTGLAGSTGDSAALTAVRVELLPTSVPAQVVSTTNVFPKSILGFDHVAHGDRLETLPVLVSSSQGAFSATVRVDYTVKGDVETKTTAASFGCS